MVSVSDLSQPLFLHLACFPYVGLIEMLLFLTARKSLNAGFTGGVGWGGGGACLISI